jgi:hypothetical protein
MRFLTRPRDGRLDDKACRSWRPDWKVRVIYWGLSIVFLVKFGKFVAMEVWDAVGPLFAQVPIVLTVIAGALLWICAAITPIGTRVEAQATTANSRVLIAGWVDSGGALHSLDPGLGPTHGIPVMTRTGAPTTAAPAPSAAPTATPAPTALGVTSQPRPAPAPAQSRIQCQATTQKGAQCKRLAEAGKQFCWQHGGRG